MPRSLRSDAQDNRDRILQIARDTFAENGITTNTIAVNTARSSTGAVPPPCGRWAKPRIKGCAKAHNSSELPAQAKVLYPRTWKGEPLSDNDFVLSADEKTGV